MTRTPNDAAARVLEAVLGTVHVTGAIFLRGEYTAPWAYESPPPADLTALLKPEAERLILFHLVSEGHCWVSLASGEREEFRGGDVVILPYAHQHCMGSPGAHEPVPVGRLLPGPPPWSTMPVIRHGGGGERTMVVCGYLECDDLLFNPFLRALPPLFRVRPPEGPTSEWMRASIRYALEGATGGGAQRLSELIFVEVMRLYAESLPPEQAGWLAALADPVVGRALVHLHAAPCEDWTVPLLASRVAVSRSVLDDRFRRMLGRAPMRYLIEWRLQLAADLLRSSALGVGDIASRVGYESEAAFNRAFRRHLGEPPARWRELARLDRV